jgi:glycosyltransferase involved in cell wall biosynthesis
MIPLSLIVIGFNMRRELPRTIRSLSPSMQRGMAGTQYELIVIDNGSTQPFDPDECRRWMPKASVHRMAEPTPSPVPAINRGLQLATGKLVGVFIDGARMASPGLLAAALGASRLHPRPVIGTHSFHLGPTIQMKSRHTPYDSTIEDALLARSGWEEDGYRLFDISTFASTGARDWFALPYETNSLFLTAEHWRRLGGYDSRYTEPGGWVSNCEMWMRACSDPGALVLMLLGEATFHQTHGGATTGAPVTGYWARLRRDLRDLKERYGIDMIEPLFVGRKGARLTDARRK